MEENNNLNETNKETNDKSIKESLEFKPIVQESITNNDFKSTASSTNSSSTNSKNKNQNKNQSWGFVKTILLPFTCGIVHVLEFLMYEISYFLALLLQTKSKL